MKKTSFLIFCAVFICTLLCAQSYFWVFSNDGSVREFAISEVDSISLVEPGYLELSPAEKQIGSGGGHFTINITANRSWTASSSNPAVVLGTTHGTGNAIVSVTALPNEGGVLYSSVITVTIENGIYKQLEVIVNSKEPNGITLEDMVLDVDEVRQLQYRVDPEDFPLQNFTLTSSDDNVVIIKSDGEIRGVKEGTAVITARFGEKIMASSTVTVIYKEFTITDCQGNMYHIVKIGDQWWMAENLRCTEYDTESERAGAKLSTSNSYTSDPYCIDASNKNNWHSTKYSGNLSEEQISKLGYLYNWAATVGLATADEAEAQEIAFNGSRQGICPNGWHVPTDAEWRTLQSYVGSNEGGKLGATSGWYNNGNGTDEYFFAALPAGYAESRILDDVGASANFWTATPSSSHFGYFASGRIIHYSSDKLYSYAPLSKFKALSVRCVKN